MSNADLVLVETISVADRLVVHSSIYWAEGEIMSCPLASELSITVTEEDYQTARHRKAAYCPLSAALARSYPGHFSPWHCGSFLAPVTGEFGGCYKIPEETQIQIIRPYDRGAFDPAVLPYTLTLTWKDATEGEEYNL